MDNSRLLIATVLCFGILIGWQYFAEEMGWIAPAPIVQTVQQASPAPGAVDAAAQMDATSNTTISAPRFAPTEGRQVRVETPLYSAVFHSGGGVLQSFTLKKYTAVSGSSAPFNMISPQAAAVSPMGILVNGQPSWNVGKWAFEGDDIAIEAGKTEKLVFRGEVNGIQLTRTLTFNADTYLIDESIALSAGAQVASARLGYTMAVSNTSGTGNYDLMSMVWDMDGSFKREDSVDTLVEEGVMKNGDIFWAGMMSNYFLAAIVPDKTQSGSFKGRILDGGVWRAAVEEPEIAINPGTTATAHVSWWVGPKDRGLLKAAPNNLSDAVDMGIFGFLAVPLLWLLTALESLAGNWGVAIILLTVLIKILFWPLTRKSYKSMEKMKKIQPMMKQLQEKYAKDKETLSREMMQLYKTYGVNPMGGCLPILVQLPVFVALYQALLNSIELRHAAFITYLPFTDMLWLADLSAKDPFYITPIIMGATMFVQQWMSPAVGDPTQRKVMMLMPLIFTVMFVNFPSGLVLYWLVNNILSIAQQWWTLRNA